MLNIKVLFISDLFGCLGVGLGSGCRGFWSVRLCGYHCCSGLTTKAELFLVVGTGSVTATAHISQRLLANVVLSIDFVWKSGTTFSRPKEALWIASGVRSVFIFQLHIFVHKVIRTQRYRFITPLQMGILNCVGTLKKMALLKHCWTCTFTNHCGCTWVASMI